VSAQAQATGRVILVGAGPGDPGLMTLRGVEALRRADTIVLDALASSELLRFAAPGAHVIDVGKRGHDAPTRPQEEITDLLIRLAREGQTVVRLKGGDPFVFGRGGEEGSALAAAGVSFEVVPGISSVVGALAYAGIPLTDRRHGASFTVATGHKDPSRVAEETRWEELGRGADTLVILMGMRNLEKLVDRVLAGGRPADTPAAVVMDGAQPTQRVVEGPLGEIAARARAAGLTAPAVVVIGDVVKLREELSWFEKRPLFGRRVLVTRTPEQASEMLAALREAGAQAILAPMLRIEAPEGWVDVDAALARLASYVLLLVTSVNAVRWLAERAATRGVPLAEFRGRVVCVGPKSAEEVARHGLAAHLVPAQRFDAEGLLETLAQGGGVAGQRCLLPRGDLARETLPEGLRAAGAEVDAVTVYRTLPPDADATALRAQLLAGELDALTFTSPSTVRHFAALLDDEALAAARHCLVAAIGPLTAEALRVVGLAPDLVPERAEAPELVAALVAAFRDQESGGAR
jgi:uroporphyrinogen III methyltransferase/synthase